ncbi:MAG: carbohydrate ABC transporter permease [Candidatus Bathyarchaeia archaeon]
MRTPKLTIYIALIIVAIFALFPFAWLISVSFKPEKEIFTENPRWIPENPTIENYTLLFTKFRFYEALTNSALIAVMCTAITVAFSSIAAYGFSRYKFPGIGVMLAILMFFRMFIPASLLVPLYDLFKFFGLLNTIYAIVLGQLCTTLPFTIWLLKGFFDELPVELEEAAFVDGMSPLQTLVRVVLPIALPGLITAALFAFWGSWNEFMFALSFATSYARTGTVAISFMMSEYKIWWGSVASGGLVLALPTLLVSYVMQKYMVRGLTAGAIR